MGADMPEYEVAHYYRLLYGALVWGIILAAVAVVVLRSWTGPRSANGPSTTAPRPAWLGPVFVATAVMVFFCVAPFVAYGTGSSPSVRGVSMVVANQAGYATSFLLVGLLAVGLGRIFGLRGRATITFTAGAALGMVLAAVTAANNGHAWLLAPP